MLIVETIRKIRVAALRDGKPIREIVRELKVSRNTVRKALRSGETEFRYERTEQPRPRLGEHLETLGAWLEAESELPRKQRRTAMVVFEDLQRKGYEGGYDAVRRFVASWWRHHRGGIGKAFVPLTFAPGEAFQFDWSHEDVEIAGMPARVKVAHVRLCHSRMMACVAFPRESQEMVFEGHERAFRLFGGTCRRGIYDNLKTVVQEILVGKDRIFNRRFQQFASHHLFEPVACTPGAGWEKGQVENQVGTVRRRLFVPRLKVADFEELNRHLETQCVAYAKMHRHPEFSDQTVWEVFAKEREHLVKVSAPFDGYKEHQAQVSTTALVRFDRNRYSVRASEAGKTVAVRAYADRVVLVSEGTVVGEHHRQFGRDRTVYDPWHYVEVLERKPGALRNGAPFQQWDLPAPIQDVRQALQGRPDADRQFVGVLSAVPRYGLEAVCRACEKAMEGKAVSRDVILNLLSRLTQDVPSVAQLPCPPRLLIEPVADCRRYDELFGRQARVA